MKEIYKFRLLPEPGRVVLGPDYQPVKNPATGLEEYIAQGVVGDTLYRKIEEADRNFAKSVDLNFIVGWDSRYNKRIYDESEIKHAQLFLLQIYSAGTAGDEYGTWYTDGVPNKNCALERDKKKYGETHQITCALSSHQVGPLCVSGQKLRKSLDIFSLWSSELIISEQLKKLIHNRNFTGAKTQPIWNVRAEPKNMMNFEEIPSGVDLISRAKEIGTNPRDRAFWSWLEEPAQLPLLERALWERMELQSVSSRANTATG